MKYLLLSLTFLAGCVSYQPESLENKKVLQHFGDLQKQTPAVESFTFEDALVAMEQNNPRLAEIRVTYEKFKDVAGIDTPLPNPVGTVGLKHGNNVQDFSSSTQPLAALSFSIPLSSRLEDQDNFNLAELNHQATVLKVEHRQLYFNLRKSYGETALYRKKVRQLKELEKLLKQQTAAAERLVDSDIFIPLDVGMQKQQSYQISLELIRTESKLLQAETALAQLVNLPKNVIKAKRLKLLSISDSDEDLVDVLIENNFKLAENRCRYDMVEAKLKWEIAKQYPDLQLGTSVGLEPGEDKQFMGLTLGIALPIFDRNQVAIARVAGERKEIKVTYAKDTAEALIELEFLQAELKNSRAMNTLFSTKILPQSKQNLKLASGAFAADQISQEKLWGFEREVLQKKLKNLDNDIELWQLNNKLERLIGRPLNKLMKEKL